MAMRSSSAALKKKLAGPAHTASHPGIPTKLAPNSKNINDWGCTKIVTRVTALITVEPQVNQAGLKYHMDQWGCVPTAIIKANRHKPRPVNRKLKIFMATVCPELERIMRLNSLEVVQMMFYFGVLSCSHEAFFPFCNKQ